MSQQPMSTAVAWNITTVHLLCCPLYADAQVSHMPLRICNVELNLTCYCRQEQLNGLFSRLHRYKYDASMQSCQMLVVAQCVNCYSLPQQHSKSIVFPGAEKAQSAPAGSSKHPRAIASIAGNLQTVTALLHSEKSAQSNSTD